MRALAVGLALLLCAAAGSFPNLSAYDANIDVLDLSYQDLDELPDNAFARFTGLREL
jgi:hypothetical protein